MSLFQASRQSATISSQDLRMRFDSQLSRMNRQMFSMGFNSGALCGNGANRDDISSGCHRMDRVSRRGGTRPAPTPLAGRTAPKRQADLARWSFGAAGRVPRLAQRRVSLVFRPTLASSRHRISMSVPGGSAARTRSASVGKLF